MSLRVYLLIIGSLLVFLQVVPLRAAPGADDPDAPKPTSTITIAKVTPEDQRTLAYTGRLSIVKQDTGIYLPGSQDLVIKLPCGPSWLSWWRQHFWYFQCRANMACKPYIGCYCNGCVCVTFIVKPTNPPCRPTLTTVNDFTIEKIDVDIKEIDVYVSPEEMGGK